LRPEWFCLARALQSGINELAWLNLLVIRMPASACATLKTDGEQALVKYRSTWL